MPNKPKPQPTLSSAVPIVVFGLDDQGKPKAARFPESQTDLATKAAAQLQLQVLPIASPDMADLAAALPAGRVHANGRGFVPYIRRDLYAKLVAAAGRSSPAPQPASKAGTTAEFSSAQSQPSGAGGDRLPRTWDEIEAGHFVIAQESLADGWYEAVVVDRVADMLSLRWRNFPRGRTFTQHRLTVALRYPNDPLTPPLTVAKGRPTTTKSPTDDHEMANRSGQDPGAGARLLPMSWQHIDVNQLVLAMDDGPWRSWWEAIVIERQGDVLTLGWRDHSRLPPVRRGRFELGLVYPSPK